MMKKARNEGMKAFIIFNDGKLIIDDKIINNHSIIHADTITTNPQHTDTIAANPQQ